MPIYEYECEQCGTRFEELVAAGTGSVACRECGSARTRRRWSAQAESFKLVKTPRETRAQEARNARLGQRTKAAFKERRRRAREARANPGRGGG
jgi:putative FmdB family regulatory protein